MIHIAEDDDLQFMLEMDVEQYIANEVDGWSSANVLARHMGYEGAESLFGDNVEPWMVTNSRVRGFWDGALDLYRSLPEIADDSPNANRT